MWFGNQFSVSVRQVVQLNNTPISGELVIALVPRSVACWWLACDWWLLPRFCNVAYTFFLCWHTVLYGNAVPQRRSCCCWQSSHRLRLTLNSRLIVELSIVARVNLSCSSTKLKEKIEKLHREQFCSDTVCQSCQKNISIKSQTVLKRVQKKAKPIVKRPEKS